MYKKVVNIIKHNTHKDLNGYVIYKDEIVKMLQEIYDYLFDKIKIIERPKHERKHRVYVTIEKSEYDSWFNKSGKIKQKISEWKKKIASIPWDGRRLNSDGSKAIFEVKFNKEEYESFIKDNFKTDEGGNITGKKKSYRENSVKGKKKFIEKLNSDKEWNHGEEEEMVAVGNKTNETEGNSWSINQKS